MKTYRHELASKRSGEEKLVRNRIRLQQSISEEERRKEKAGRFKKTEQSRLESTVNQKATCERSITEIEERSKLIQSLIGRLERERRSLFNKKSMYAMLKGKLRLPVQGKIVSVFKERGQNGIEIEAPTGAIVRTVLPGKVVYADWFKGFGNLMIIDHGNGIHTIFGNCSRPSKKSGDTVSEGEVIAQIGSSESDENSRLYFEIRHQGKPQDPMKWILSHRNKHP
jgi:septal ring factor EnvC (AmiA/AmiB activator)